MLNQELISKEFGFLGDDIFLNVSQVCMPPKRVQEAYGGFMAGYVKKFGEGVVDEAWGIVADCREKVAELVNAEHSHEIAFVKNTAEGMSILASCYPLKAGDSVVIADQEHQSTLSTRPRRCLSSPARSFPPALWPTSTSSAPFAMRGG